MCAIDTFPRLVLCPDGAVGRVLDDLPPPPEAFGPDGYPSLPDASWLKVEHAGGRVAYWPAESCKPLRAGEGA